MTMRVVVLMLRRGRVMVVVTGVLEVADNPRHRQTQQQRGRKLHPVVMVELQLGQ
jgi:hypothetical protein